MLQNKKPSWNWAIDNQGMRGMMPHLFYTLNNPPPKLTRSEAMAMAEKTLDYIAWIRQEGFSPEGTAHLLSEQLEALAGYSEVISESA